VLIEDGEIRAAPNGKTLYVAPAYDNAIEKEIAAWFEKYYTIRFRNYPVTLDYLHEAQQIACRH
jgi:formylmethanofuran dehydrogenase subunit A